MRRFWNEYRSRSALLLVAIAIPPLGILFLCTRARAGVFRKLLGSLVLVLLSFIYLHFFFGLHFELDGETEIEHFDVPVSPDHDVARLDVPMHDAGGVCSDERRAPFKS